MYEACSPESNWQVRQGMRAISRTQDPSLSAFPQTALACANQRLGVQIKRSAHCLYFISRQFCLSSSQTEMHYMHRTRTGVR
jgi:hypothetical protein